MKLPNELLVQIEGKNFDDMSRDRKLAEVNWCMERCGMNRSEYPEKSKYYTCQISALRKLLNKL